MSIVLQRYYSGGEGGYHVLPFEYVLTCVLEANYIFVGEKYKIDFSISGFLSALNRRES